MKKKFKKIILAFIIIFAILVGIAYAYIYTDAFKTEKQLFLKYLINNTKQLEEINVEPYASVFEKNKNENVQFKTNMQATVKEDGEIRKTTMDYSIASDLKQNKYSISFDSKIDEDEYLKFNVVLSDEILGIKIGGVHDKYLSLKNKNLKEFIKKFNIEEKELEKIPDKIDFSKQINMTDEEIEKTKNILKNHSNVFVELLEKGEYQKNKDVKIEINNQTFNTNKYNFNISEKEAKNAILIFADGLINDQEFINMYLSDLDSETLKEFKDVVRDTIKEIEEEEDKGKITIGVYEHNGKTIKTEIVMEETEMYFSILNDGSSSNIEFSTKEQTPEGEELYGPDSQNIVRIKNSVSGTNGQLTIQVENKYDKDDIQKLNEEEEKEYKKYGYGTPTDYSEIYEDSSTKFVINAVKKDDKNIELTMNSNDVESNLDLEIIEDLDIDIKLKMNVIFGNNIIVEELNEENSLIFNDYTIEDFEKLGEEIYTNVEKTMEENPNCIFSQMGQANGVLLESEETKKEQLEMFIDDALQLTIVDGLSNYYSNFSTTQTKSKTEYIAEYLTIENIKLNCTEYIKELEIVEGNVFKIISDDDTIYFAKVELTEKDDIIRVESVEIFTEEEYNQ